MLTHRRVLMCVDRHANLSSVNEKWQNSVWGNPAERRHTLACRWSRNEGALIAVVLYIDKLDRESQDMIRGLIKAVVIGWVMKKLFGHEDRDERGRRRGAR